MDNNFRRNKKSGLILLRDLQNLLKRKFNLKSEDGKMIRFLDQTELKIVTQGDHVIFRSDEQQNKTYIM